MYRSRHCNLLQTNLNHCAGAQNLLTQALAQWSIDVAVVAEPYYVPDGLNWAGATDGLVAIFSPKAACTLSLKENGPGYVAAVWGDITVIGVYFSPNRSLSELDTYL